MIDRKELESGSISSQTRQTYALSREDILADPSILNILRRNLDSSDPELLEITIMRLGVRADDFWSIEKFFEVLERNVGSLVRSAALGALSSLHFKLYDLDRGRAQEIFERVKRLELTAAEFGQVRKQFGRNFRAKGISIEYDDFLHP